MRKGSSVFLCLVCATVICLACLAAAPAADASAGEAQAHYQRLYEQAGAVLKEAIAVPEPPATSLSCAETEKAEADSRSLTEFQRAFNDPEGDLCARMLAAQKELQLAGAEPDYEREAALMDRLGQKALSLIKDYGQDVERVPAIALVGIQTATGIQLLGLDQAGRSEELTDAISRMYEKAIEGLFRRLTEEHDYALVRPILEAARASLLLSGASGVNVEDVLARLSQTMRFEMTLNYDFEQTGNHRWAVQAVFEVGSTFGLGDGSTLTGSGTGSLLSFSWDDSPEFAVSAPDFPVQATLNDFDPCGGSVTLLLTPFHPLSETALFDGEAMDWPLLRISWETAFQDSLQEDGLYRFPLTLNNLDSTAISETLVYSVPDNEVSLEILLVHKPQL